MYGSSIWGRKRVLWGRVATCLMVRIDGWMLPQGLQASDVGGMAASDDRERGPFFPHLGVMGWGCLPIC